MLSMAYISAALIYLPNLVDKIVFNHLHVAKMLCAVVDKTRQAEMKQIPSSDRKDTHCSRYLWFYSKQNRSGAGPRGKKLLGGCYPKRASAG